METQPNSKAVKTLSLGHFILDNYSAFATPILPLLVLKLNTTMAVITFILSIGHLCSAIAQPIFGYIADRWRKRFFLVYGMLLGCIFYPLIGITPNLMILTLCVAIGSLGVGFYHPQATSMMILFSNQEKSIKDMGLFLASGTLGYSISPLISSFVTDFWGMKYLPLTSLTGIICVFLILKFVPKISHIKVTEERPNFREAFKIIVKDRIMQILFMIAVFKSMVSILYSTFMPFIWKEQGFSISQIGIFIFIFLAVSALGTYSSQYFERKFGTIQTFRLSMLSTLPLVILYFLTYKHFPILSLIFYFLIGYCAMLSVAINMVLAQKHLPQYKSIVAGIIGGFSFGSVGIFLGLFGLIGQTYGVDRLLIYTSILPFVCSYFLKFLPKNKVG